MLTRVAAVVAAVVLLAGCSDGDSDDSADGPTTPASTPRSPDQLFLDSVRAGGVDVSQVSDTALLAAGHAVCTGLDNGAAPIDVYADAVETAGDAGVVVLGVAVTTLCREHQAAVQELAQQLG